MKLPEHAVHRASLNEIEEAFELVTEYYEEVGVVAREDREKFEEQYFGEGSGVWMAVMEGETVGCVALRKMVNQEDYGEIKRMYVRSSHRGNNIATALLGALEEYALNYGFTWLYLDTTDSMVAAARFYERNGYQRCERYNDNPQATVFMRKRIGES